MTTTIKLTGLFIYPVKSLAGITLESSQVDAMGLKYDRRWMLVSPGGRFMSQRTHPKMALIQPVLKDGKLSLTYADKPEQQVPEVNDDSEGLSVTVWNDEVNALHVSQEVDQWLTDILGAPCRLVYIPDTEIRQCDQEYAEQGDRTGFSDGFPLLLISEGSLADLNVRLDHSLPMKRFRPNLVVSGCNAFAEDEWKHIQLGQIPMRVVKPCSRCVITTVNPETGQKQGVEPLKTLASYRQRDNKVFFGQNVIHNETGQLSCGDKLVVKTRN